MLEAMGERLDNIGERLGRAVGAIDDMRLMPHRHGPHCRHNHHGHHRYGDRSARSYPLNNASKEVITLAVNELRKVLHADSVDPARYYISVLPNMTGIAEGKKNRGNDLSYLFLFLYTYNNIVIDVGFFDLYCTAYKTMTFKIGNCCFPMIL